MNLINVGDVIEKQKISGFQIRVMVLCGAVLFLDGANMQSIGYVAPSISEFWNLAPGALKDVFAAGLVGLMVGGLILGPAADRIGRKSVIIFCTLAFAVCTLLTVTARSVNSLLVWRFVSAIGLGGAIPNAIALTSEYSSHRDRATAVMLMFCAWPLGSALGGICAAQLIFRFGWTAIFWVGGLLPLALAPLLVFALPESIWFLALRGTDDSRIRNIFLRMNPALAFPPQSRFTAGKEQHLSGFAVPHLFRDGHAAGTVLLWVIFFMNFMVLYFCANWLPTLLNNAGVPIQLAMITTSAFQIGGICGVLVLSWMLHRFPPLQTLAGTFLVSGLFVGSIGFLGSTISLIIPVVSIAGFCVVGAQIAANAIAASYYPTNIRSTGIGWALGSGRIGSIIGPWVAGYCLSLQWQASSIFLAAVVPALCAAVAVFIMVFIKCDL